MSDNGWMFEQVKRLVAAGTTKKALFDSVKGMTMRPEAAEVEGKLRGYAAKLWNQAAAEEQGWTDVSTNDRIDAAFQELSSAGLFSAQDFTCCSSCGHSEAAGTMAETGARGYVFYHQQDTDRAITGGGLLLAFGAYDGEPPSVEAIGREICGALDRFGIPHTWNGSGESRIQIEPFEWRKRRVTTAPPIPPGERGRVLVRPEGEGEAPAPPPKPIHERGLRHPDGRQWSATLGYKQLTIRIRDADGDLYERTVKCDDPRAELERRLAELGDDGFVVAPDDEADR